MKPETSSFTSRLPPVFLLILVIAGAVICGGCRAMADPDGTDLPWAERPDWEYAPSIPQSMMQQ